MDLSVKVHRLTKNFEVTVKKPGLKEAIKALFNPEKKTVHALKQISFTIEEGELVGFIGPNGAGKTTTLKTLSGLLYPTSGHVLVEGFDPWDRKSEFLKKIALVMGQKNQLWWDLPAIETFELNRAIYEIPRKKYEESLNELVSLLDVKKLLSIPVRRLSLGQRMRLELVAALIHGPKVLFLDEPTIGLDVLMQRNLREFIKEYNIRYKATIILTSHYMGDVEELCKRVIIINFGRIIFDGLLSSLVEKYSPYKKIRAVLTQYADPKKIDRLGRVSRFEYPELILEVPNKKANLIAVSILKNFQVEDITIEGPQIEDVIAKVYRENKR